MVNFIKERITQLRLLKGVSEYQMSFDLGHSRSYVNNISSGKSMPSVPELLAICEYFEISPRDFFDERHENPALTAKAIEEIEQMDDDDVLLILTLINRIKRK